MMSDLSPSLPIVTKTNLSVHEDKYRVPYVKVSHRQYGLILFDFCFSELKTAVCV